MKNVSIRHLGLARQFVVFRPGTKIPVKVIAPSAPPARATASGGTSDSPEQPDTRTRPPVGRTEASASGSRRRGGMLRGLCSFHESVEVGFALLHERTHALLRFLGFVKNLTTWGHGRLVPRDVSLS